MGKIDVILVRYVAKTAQSLSAGVYGFLWRLAGRTHPWIASRIGQVEDVHVEFLRQR